MECGDIARVASVLLSHFHFGRSSAAVMISAFYYFSSSVYMEAFHLPTERETLINCMLLSRSPSQESMELCSGMVMLYYATIVGCAMLVEISINVHRPHSFEHRYIDGNVSMTMTKFFLTRVSVIKQFCFAMK
jgi:hypothetical protein